MTEQTKTTAAPKLAYTAEQSAELLAAYAAATDEDSRDVVINKFAVAFAKTHKSIVAKLSRSGVYIKKERQSKAGGAVISKEELADAIGKVLGMTSENDISSMSKMTKVALQTIFKALANSKPIAE